MKDSEGKKSIDIGAIANGLSSLDEVSTSSEPLAELPAMKAMGSSRSKDGKVTRTVISDIDPAKCKRWKYADRFDEWFTYENCQDMIESIRSGGQEIPGVVRKLVNDPDGFEYEVIYGGRRHFSTSYLTNKLNEYTPFKAIVKSDLSDSECAALMDLENRVKADISDFERCVSYRRQIGKVEGIKGVVETLGELKVAIESEMISDDSEHTNSITKSALSQMITAGQLNEIPCLIKLFSNRRISISWTSAYKLMMQWNADNGNNQPQITQLALGLEESSLKMSTDEILKCLIDNNGANNASVIKPDAHAETYKISDTSNLKVKSSKKELIFSLPIKAISIEEEESLLTAFKMAIADARKSRI